MTYIHKYGQSKGSPRSDRIVDIECYLVHETEKAYLLDNGSVKEWFPKAVVDYDRRDKVASMPEYYALQKGFV